jgi:hypothetical protein
LRKVVVVHRRMAIRSRLERGRKRCRHASGMSRDAGESERFANKTSATVSQGGIPALHRSRLSCFLPDRCRLCFWTQRLRRLPPIGVAVSRTGGVSNGFPPTRAGLFPSLASGRGHDLSPLATPGDPDPGLLRLLPHKRPPLIHFQDRRLCSGGISREQRLAHSCQLCGLLFSRKSTSVRDPPTVRSRPRQLLRSSEARRISSRRSSGEAGGVGCSRLGLLPARQRYVCFPLGARPFRAHAALPQGGQWSVIVPRGPSTSQTIFALTLPLHSLFDHYRMCALQNGGEVRSCLQ